MGDKVYAIKKGNEYFASNEEDNKKSIFTYAMCLVSFYDTWQQAKDDMEFMGHYHINMSGAKVVEFAEVE